MPLFSIPSEILFLIAEQCDSLSDICHLRTTCRKLYSLTPYLYKYDAESWGSIAVTRSASKGNSDSLKIALRHGKYRETCYAIRKSLSLACEAGNANIVELLVKEFPLIHLNMRSAFPRGERNVIMLLLEAAAARKAQPCFIHEEKQLAREALQLASSHGCCEVATLILERYPQLHLDRALSNAFFSRNRSMVQLLIRTAVAQSKRFFSSCEILQKAQFYGISDLLETAPTNVRRTHEEFLLMEACRSGDHVIASRMIEQGVPVDMEDSMGMPPLFHAIEKECDPIVQLLLENSAPIDAGSENDRLDAVAYAVLYGKIDILRTLMRNKVPYNRASAFLFAINNRNPDILKLLQPDIDKRYINGKTALHIAADKGFPEAVDVLLKAGAPALKDDRGYTPRDYAQFRGDRDVLKLLDNVYT
ncbi:hypothetical protein SI65_06024 [Aspergillus cristatus]|uniref:Uncharacterized protein n=1 Tax=Aspergillus cristatus TaxID=573508 RepID=A0A1E3BAZ2_ASPCR|nr:hypothetical protein SI65_06024 [Aspergillus cristatus]